MNFWIVMSKITPILFSANPTFLFMALYLKRKRGIGGKFQKISFTVPVMERSYSWQLDHLILFFMYNTDYFLKLRYLSEIVFKQKIGNRNFICASENTLPKLKTGAVYLSKL